MMQGRVLFFKGGEGSGNHGHHGRPGRVGGSGVEAPPTSSAINTEEEAVAYWHKHFANREMALTVHAKSVNVKILLFFDADNNHAYSEDLDKTGKNDQRYFNLERARVMDDITAIIEHPKFIFGDGRRELYLEYVKDGKHHLIVLEYNASKKRYSFVTSYNIPTKKLKALRDALQPTLPKGEKGPMKKSMGPSSSHSESQVFDASPGAFQRPPGFTSPSCDETSIRQNQPMSLVGLLMLRKSMDGFDLYEVSDPGYMAKASLPEGARWITIHPHGADEKGQPLLIQPNADGSAHVIGPAHGDINDARRSPATATRC